MHWTQGRVAFYLLTVSRPGATFEGLAQWCAMLPRKGRTMTLEKLKAAVDELGTLKAAIAELTDKERDLKTLIAASGYAELDGDLFRATVSLSERTTLETEKVKALLSAAQIAACSKTTEVTTVRVAARKRAAK